MAAYEYVALDETGLEQKGMFEADSARQVRQILREKSWTPVTVESMMFSRQEHQAKGRLTYKRSIRTSELAILTRQLATLVQAAMPLEEVLFAVASQQEKLHLRNIILSVRSKVMEGYTLAQSMEAYPHIFPKMYIASVAAGEHSSYLDRVLQQLADFTEAKMQSKRLIQQAVIYPVILMVACIAIVSFLLGYVLPDIISVFMGSGQKLPPITLMLIEMSNWMQQYWPLLLAMLVLSVFAVRFLLNRPNIRYLWDKLLLDLPGIGKFTKSYNTSRFASTLSILTKSGITLVDGLNIAAQVVNNVVLKQTVERIGTRVSEGSSLNKAMLEAGYFPPLMQHMIANGEATGELDQMLERAATHQQQELSDKVALCLSLLEPMMLILMGAVVMTIVIAILLPVLNMNQLLS
ncbi:type II secretion system inner membrane protein GspF [Endozoicomonas sp. ALB115]|uniref:type II secretion system inner membrane protein GspF n=1 Tax=Endozoicomonas sp. ALB115 TaxID=3403074 RepID=UPI003BB73FFC